MLDELERLTLMIYAGDAIDDVANRHGERTGDLFGDAYGLAMLLLAIDGGFVDLKNDEILRELVLSLLGRSLFVTLSSAGTGHSREREREKSRSSWR